MNSKELVKLVCRNEPVYLHKNDIVHPEHKDWFLKILFTEFDDDNIVELNEDKNTVMSIIDSLRYNKLIIYPNVSLDYLYNLADKWCVPEFIISQIEFRIKLNIQNDNSKNSIVDKNYIPFRCNTCGKGFIMAENKFDSCKTNGESFGYHTMTTHDLKYVYLN